MKGKIYECCEDCPHSRSAGNLDIICSKGAKKRRKGDRFFSDCPEPDLFEAVQCKDCKNYLPHQYATGICGIHDYITAPTDFCSFGKKEGGQKCNK